MNTVVAPCGCEFQQDDQGKVIWNLSFENINLDCPFTWNLISEGKTKGIFQLESHLGRHFAKALKPHNIEQLSALLALIRPGCLEAIVDEKSMTEHYIDRKNGKEEIKYFHDAIKPALESTYGVLCIHEDTYVSLYDGREQQIKNLSNESILNTINLKTYQNEPNKCLGVQKSPKKYGIELTLDNGYRVKLTPDHEVSTADGWKRVSDLEINKDAVQIILQEKVTDQHKTLNCSFLGDEQHIAYIIGHLIGDGSYSSIICLKKEEAYTYLIKWIQTNLPKLHIRHYARRNCWYIVISIDDQQKLISFIQSLGLDASDRAKEIPDIIFQLNANSRRAFIAGLIDNNSHFAIKQRKRNDLMVNILSKSPAVINGIRKLLSIEGIASIIQNNQASIHISNTYKLEQLINDYLLINKIDKSKCVLNKSVQYGCTTKASIERYLKYKRSITKKKHYVYRPFMSMHKAKTLGMNFGDTTFMRIIDIEPLHESSNFYSISVENNHNLITNGIVVKNCYQEQSMQIARDVAGFDLQQADTLRKCLTGNSLFLTQYGPRYIRDLCDPFENDIKILSIDVLKNLKYCKLIDVWASGFKETYRVRAMNGYYIDVTKDHQILTQDGWKEAQNLTNTDFLLILPGQSFYVTLENKQKQFDDKSEYVKFDSMRSLGKNEVFDYSIDNHVNGAFVNGIFVHNSIGKKKPELMTKIKKEFIDGCLNVGKVTEEDAKIIFEWIEKSQRYAFNKCVVGDTRLLGRNGRNLTVAEMYNIKNDQEYAASVDKLDLHTMWNLFGNYGKTFSMDEEGKTLRNIIKNITYEGKQEVWQLILKNFSSIEVTWNHKFPTDQGIKELTDFDGSEKLFCRIPTGRTTLVGIRSIKQAGIKDVYNIEMEVPYHNFITDTNIVSCNSHSIAYAYNAYLTAYCKTHFKHAFYTAWLNYAKAKPKFQEEVQQLIEDARKNGVSIVKPSLSKLNRKFKIDDNKIYFGLTDIKSIGDKVYEQIVEIIQNSEEFLQQFQIKNYSFNNWSWIVLLLLLMRKINSKAVESLILSGALDYLKLGREILLHEYSIFTKLKPREQLWIHNYVFHITGNYDVTLQTCLLELLAAPTGKNGGIYHKSRLPFVRSLCESCCNPGYEVKDTVRKISNNEQLILGVSITKHPIEQYDTSHSNCTCLEFLRGKLKKNIILPIFIQNCREYKCKSGNNKGRIMAFLSISDNTCAINNVCIFPDNFELYKDKLIDGNCVTLIGHRSMEKEMFIIDKVTDMQFK